MSATSILAGLLGGINESAEANRAEIRRREDEQDQFERRELQRIASSPEYMPEIRDRAATALLDLASNPGRRRKGSFTENLMGVNRIQAHPAVSELMRFMREPETKGGLPQGLIEAPPKAIPATPPPAVTTPPTTAAMPPTPAGQPGGGPPSAGALGSPSAAPTGQAAPTPPPLAPGLLPVNQSTGAPPQTQGPSVTVPRRILRTPAEIAIELARAKQQGDTEGEIEGLVTSGMPREQALEVVRLGKIRSARLGATRDSYAEGEVIRKPDGTYVQILYNRYNPADRIEIPAMAPSLRSVAAPTDEAQVAAELFESRYPQFKGDPAGLLRAISPAERAVLAQTMMRRTANQQGMNTTARGAAEAQIPLSTNQRLVATTGLQDDWRKADLLPKTMRQQSTVMDTAIARFPTDPIGASEAFRTAYITMFDPNATVREGDYVRLGLGRSLSDRVEGFFQSLSQGGGTIPYATMVEMANTAKTVAQQAQSWSVDEAARIDATARAYGIDPSLIRGVAPPPTVGGQTPPPASTPTTGVPGRGARVGNQEYNTAGGVMRSRSTGALYGTVNGQRVELYEEGGKYYIMGPAQ